MTEVLFDEYGHPIQKLIDPEHPEQLFDKYGHPHILLEDASGLDLAAANAIPVMVRRGVFPVIATHSACNQGVAGSGNLWGAAGYSVQQTGTTPNSWAVCTINFLLLAGRRDSTFDFDKAIELNFLASRENSDAEAVARLFIAPRENWPIEEEDIVSKGFGIEIQNYALYGISHNGDSKYSVNLNTNLSDEEAAEIRILHYPGEKIEWYVDGVLKGTQSNPARIPAGVRTWADFGWSIKNGATGGVNADFRWGLLTIWHQK